MADNEAEVRLSAQTQPLKSNLQDATTVVANAFRAMREALFGFGTESSKTTAQVIANNATMASSVGALKDATASGFASMSMAMRGLVGGVAASATERSIGPTSPQRLLVGPGWPHVRVVPRWCWSVHQESYGCTCVRRQYSCVHCGQ